MYRLQGLKQRWRFLVVYTFSLFSFKRDLLSFWELAKLNVVTSNVLYDVYTCYEHYSKNVIITFLYFVFLLYFHNINGLSLRVICSEPYRISFYTCLLFTKSICLFRFNVIVWDFPHKNELFNNYVHINTQS